MREHSFSTGGDEAKVEASKGARGGLPATLNGGTAAAAASNVQAEDEGATALGTGASRYTHVESASAGKWCPVQARTESACSAALPGRCALLQQATLKEYGLIACRMVLHCLCKGTRRVA